MSPRLIALEPKWNLERWLHPRGALGTAAPYLALETFNALSASTGGRARCPHRAGNAKRALLRNASQFHRPWQLARVSSSRSFFQCGQAESE
jgi:hypothetical protein